MLRELLVRVLIVSAHDIVLTVGIGQSIRELPLLTVGST